MDATPPPRPDASGSAETAAAPDARPAPRPSPRLSLWRIAMGAAAAALIALCWWRLEADTAGLERVDVAIDGTPATIWSPASAAAAPRPVVVIAHGFAGSRQLMKSFALTLAQNGFVTVSFDYLGHGRNPRPLVGDVTKETGATAALVAETLKVAQAAAGLAGSDGRVILLGHSMASDIIVRAARQDAERVVATIAISLFSREVTDAEPANLLVVTGGQEAFLTAEALTLLRAAAGPEAVEAETYPIGDGGARRVAVADGVDHVGVLYSRETLAETLAWANRVAAGAPDPDPRSGARPALDPTALMDDATLAVRGPWILGLLLGVLALAWPLSSVAPRLAPPAGAPTLTRGRRWALALGPALATPLLLWPAPFDFLAVLVADYLALHFALYGALTAALLWRYGAAAPRLPSWRLGLACAGAAAFAVGAVGLAIDAYVANFAVNGMRAPVVAALFMGAAVYCLADAFATHGQPFWFRAATKIGFLISLALANSINLQELFYLASFPPVVAIFFLLYGLLGL
ncbi:MAG: alpha/beta fold hydrolase [Pseudomonadota bacterium]